MTNAEKFKKIFGFDLYEINFSCLNVKCSDSCPFISKCDNNVDDDDFEWTDFWNSEYHVPGENNEYKNHKCGECAYLNINVKTIIGYKCERPNYTHKTKTGHLKYKHTPACKAFKEKDEQKCKN